MRNVGLALMFFGVLGSERVNDADILRETVMQLRLLDGAGPKEKQRSNIGPLSVLALFLSTLHPCNSFLPATSKASVASKLKGKMILAPLTEVGNPPFRRLCADFGCEASMGEMILASGLLAGEGLERARLERTNNEVFFGAQIATTNVSEGVAAAKMAAEKGADFIDLNCGCPIRKFTNSGIGSALLSEPDKLAALVRGIVQDSPIPVTVKIRKAAAGYGINVQEVAKKVRDAGAAAVTVHGRTAEERYSKAADWASIRQVVVDREEDGSTTPVIGNGDILTWYEARQRIEDSGVDAVMVGRGALIKPWIFDEFKNNRSWEPSVTERIEIYHRLACYCKEFAAEGWERKNKEITMGNQSRRKYYQETLPDWVAQKRAMKFLKLHLGYFAQYRPLPADRYSSKALDTPLFQICEDIDMNSSPVEKLLSCKESFIQEMLAEAVCNSTTSAEAIRKVTALAEGEAQTAMLKLQKAVANISEIIRSGEAAELYKEVLLTRRETRRDRKHSQKRHKRSTSKQSKHRTPEEIAIIRAVRAELRSKNNLPAHVHGPSRGR